MTGLWLEDGELSVRHDLPVPAPGPDEVLVAPLVAGICGTDHQLASGYAGFRGVPGHEFVARVLEGPDDLRDTRVVAEINLGCGECHRCESSGPEHCADRRVVGIRGHQGAFAERLALPADNLHVLPPEIPDEIGVFVEPLAAALRVGEQIGSLARSEVLVIGDGRLGQLIARALAPRSGRFRLQGRHRHKMELLRRWGIPADDRPTPAGEWDVVIDCTGSASGFDAARRAVRPGGTIVLKSTGTGDPHPVELSSMVVDEVRLVGSRCGPFAPAIRLLSESDLGLSDLVDGRFPLARGPEAFRLSARGETLKVLVECSVADGARR